VAWAVTTGIDTNRRHSSDTEGMSGKPGRCDRLTRSTYIALRIYSRTGADEYSISTQISERG
jgi:hypothetical protein